MKRDYFYIADLDDIADASRVLRRLPGWFNDYNEQALGMLSPREWRRGKRPPPTSPSALSSSPSPSPSKKARIAEGRR